MPGRRTPAGELARGLVLVGTVGVVVSLFLKWDEGNEFSGFEGLTRFDVVLLGLVVVAGVLAVIDLFIYWRGLLPFAGLLGAYAFGATMFAPIEAGFGDLGPGWFIAMAFSLVLVVGGILGTVQSLDPGGGGDGPQSPSPAVTPASAPNPPPGWYQDPWGQAPQRFWSGSEWTERIQS